MAVQFYTATVAEGGNQAIDVSSNDFDVDGSIDPATITIIMTSSKMEPHKTATVVRPAKNLPLIKLSR